MMETEQPRKAQLGRAGVWHGGKDLGRVYLQTLQPSQAKGDSEWRSLGPQAVSHVTHPDPDSASLGPFAGWGSDLGWDDIVGNIPEPLPKL